MWSEKNWQHIFLKSLGVACSEKVITLLVIRVAHVLYIYHHTNNLVNVYTELVNVYMNITAINKMHMHLSYKWSKNFAGEPPKLPMGEIWALPNT